MNEKNDKPTIKKQRIRTKCEHGKDKRYCRLCGGSAFCKHDKRKSHCKKCGGSAYCEHNKLNQYCKECRGSALCEHNKEKRYCKECDGSALCEHDKRKSHCKKCGGSAFCKHDKWKSYCKECGGSELCEHDKRKSRCKECGGSAYCEHKKAKRYCKECDGSGICKHGKDKRYCKSCHGSALCKTPLCETTGTPKYGGYCLRCCIHLFPEIKVARNYKTKENDVADRIKTAFPEANWICDKIIKGGCSSRRPDLFLDIGTHIIIVEVDEHKHKGYECICENKRLMEISKDLGHMPLVVIRFNPDSYKDENGNHVSSCWKSTKQGIMTVPRTKQKKWNERIQCLTETIQYWMDNSTSKTIEVVELYY